MLQIKHLFKIFSGISVFLLGGAADLHAIPPSFIPADDHSLILESPEGTLKYYEINAGGKNFYAPVVFTADNHVYIRNMLGLNSLWGEFVWSEGVYDESKGTISFPQGTPLCYSPYTYLQGYDQYASRMYYGKMDKDESGKSVFVQADGDIILRIDPAGAITFEKGENDKNLYYSQLLPMFFFDEEEALRETEKKNPVNGLSMTVSDKVPEIPNPNSLCEDYQIVFKPMTSFADNNGGVGDSMTALHLKGYIEGNQMYLRGMSVMRDYGDPNACLKGEIKDGKVYFQKGQLIGINRYGKFLYMNPVDITADAYFGGSADHLDISCKYTGNDLIFDYDPGNGVLSNPNSGFIFSDTPMTGRNINLSDNSGGWPLMIFPPVDLFYNPVISKIPNETQIPSAPGINGTKVEVSYFDKNGHMIDPDYLYLRVYKDGMPYGFNSNEISNWFNFERFGTSDLIPFKLLDSSFGTEEVPLVNSSYYFKRLSFTPSDAELLYINDGVEISSKGTSGIEGVENGTINGQQGDNIIYDLTGRRIDKENPAPGIYIRNGKKFIIR